jgi:hypothetical protein|tara:strand:- start:235 stop:1368 length:1134 start_codon:yes stop_codon:yes gene_type:complete
MQLTDLIPLPDSKTISQIAEKVFGRTIDIKKLNESKARTLRDTFANRLVKLENKLGSSIANNKTYLENKMFLETVDKYISEIPTSMQRIDRDMAHEIIFVGDNDAMLYKAQYTMIIRNLLRKEVKGIFNYNKGIKLLRYWVDNVVKRNYKDLGVMQTIDVNGATRNEAAKMALDNIMAEMQLGNYDDNSSMGTKGLFYPREDDGQDMGSSDMNLTNTSATQGKMMGSNAEEVKANESVIAEGEVEVAEHIMASKNMVDKIQGMLEDLGEMVNEDLPPLTDSIRDNMDSATAETFSGMMSAVLSQTLEAMRIAREGADTASRVLTGETPQVDNMMGDETEVAMEPTIDQEETATAEEDFGAAEEAQGGDEEVGRQRRA